MKRLQVWTLVVLITLLAVATCGAAVKVGNVVPIKVPTLQNTISLSGMPDNWPEKQEFYDGPGWVTVMNPDGISSTNYQFKFGEEAYIGYDGSFKLIRLDGERVLVEYSTLDSSGGTAAPNGTLFFLPKTEFTRLLAKYEKQIRDERQQAREEQDQASRRAKRLAPERMHVQRLLIVIPSRPEGASEMSPSSSQTLLVPQDISSKNQNN